MNGSSTTAYPEVSLWGLLKEKQDKLEIINPGDFTSRDDLLYRLGFTDTGQWRSLEPYMGICKREELQRRLELSRMLMDDGLREFIVDFGQANSIPNTEEEFIHFFHPDQEHNPYWTTVWELCDRLRNSPTRPPQIQEFLDAMETQRGLEQRENQTTASIIEQLANMALIEGVMRLKVQMALPKPPEEDGDDNEDKPKRPAPPQIYSVTYVELMSEQTHGHTVFSQALDSIYDIDYPDWTHKWYDMRVWFGFGRLKRRQIDRLNKERKQKSYEAMVFDHANSAMISDVKAGVKKILDELKLTPEQLKDVKTDEIEVMIYFSFDKDGLVLRIVDIKAPMPAATFDFKYARFEGYDPERVKEIASRRVGLSEALAANRQSARSDKLRAYFDQLGGLFDYAIKVASPGTDQSYRWFAISNLMGSDRFKPIIDEMRAHRRYFSGFVSALKTQNARIDTIVETARRMKAPICVPELLPEGEHSLSFEDLFPISLYDNPKVKKVVTIDHLPDLGANILGLNGKHGGGKTATEEALMDALYLAHSGLPVFANQFRFNLKRAIGCVFMERGDGSTVELMLEKMVKVLRRCKRLKGNEVVLVLDELGSATQEGDGTQLGIDYLTKLASMGVSVIFSTQIQALAKYAQDHLGAKCFQFDRQHRITPGIGDGGLAELRAEKGLDRLLR